MELWFPTSLAWNWGDEFTQIVKIPPITLEIMELTVFLYGISNHLTFWKSVCKASRDPGWVRIRSHLAGRLILSTSMTKSQSKYNAPVLRLNSKAGKCWSIYSSAFFLGKCSWLLGNEKKAISAHFPIYEVKSFRKQEGIRPTETSV